MKAFAALARPKTQVAKQVRKLCDARPTNLYVSRPDGTGEVCITNIRRPLDFLGVAWMP